MKYYSDLTKKFYESEDACLKAEKDKQKADAEAIAKKEVEAAARKEDAHKVEGLLKASIEARKAYNTALSDFCEKYGSYHTTVKSSDLGDCFDILIISLCGKNLTFP